MDADKIPAKDLEKISKAVNFCAGCCEPAYFYAASSARFVRFDARGHAVYSVEGCCECCGYDSRDEVSIDEISRLAIR